MPKPVIPVFLRRRIARSWADYLAARFGELAARL